mgnify:CR=1 FL=1
MTEQSRSLRISPRFCGPRNTGNGGYVAGLLARQIDGPVEVTLRRPPPLGRELRVVSGESSVDLYDGDSLIANAVAAPLHLELPSPPKLGEARKAAERYRGRERHPFPACFVCGPQRTPGDGLRIFPGPMDDGSGSVAGTWECGEPLADAEGFVRPEFICAALDCPGHWACAEDSGDAGDTVSVLARFHCETERALPAGSEVVAMAWPLACSQRHSEAATALFDGMGHLIGRARTVWVSVPRERFPDG